MKILDLYCGRGGWSKPLIRQGIECHGVDIVDHGYPGVLHLQDVLTFDPTPHGPFDFILASPPCPEYTRWHLPWTRRLNPPPPNMRYFIRAVELCQICKCPGIFENVIGAQAWIGPAPTHYGPYYLWGDLPGLDVGRPGRNARNKSQGKHTRKSFGNRAAARAEIPRKLASRIADHVIMTAHARLF